MDAISTFQDAAELADSLCVANRKSISLKLDALGVLVLGEGQGPFGNISYTRHLTWNELSRANMDALGLTVRTVDERLVDVMSNAP